MKRLSIILIVFILGGASVYGQMFPERRTLRSGNREYERENYEGAEEKYREGIGKNPNSYEGYFNLGDVLFRQERFEEAESVFNQLEQIPVEPEVRSKSYYNHGNSQFAQGKLKEALETYKNAMRLNPEDQEAKFNYAFTKKLLEEGNEDNDDEGDDENDPENDGSGDDGQSDPNPDSGNDEEGDGNDSGAWDGNEDDNNGGQEESQQRPEDGMSPEEAKRILNAIQNREDNTREKVDAQQGTPVRSGKNW